MNRLDTAEEKISSLEDAVIETTHNEVYRGKEIEKIKQKIKDIEKRW